MSSPTSRRDVQHVYKNAVGIRSLASHLPIGEQIRLPEDPLWAKSLIFQRFSCCALTTLKLVLNFVSLATWTANFFLAIGLKWRFSDRHELEDQLQVLRRGHIL